MTNLGPSACAGAVITDTFPTKITGVTFTATQTGGASGFTAAGSGNIQDTVTMPTSSTITYQATGTVPSSVKGKLTNTVTVAVPSGVIDPHPANNKATDSDSITP